MNAELTIRPYRADDHGSLMSFLERVYAGMGYSFLPDTRHVDIRNIDDVYINNRGCFHVVDVLGEIHGSVGVRQLSEETAELKRLYLESAYRGKGLGHRLCVAAINDAELLKYRYLRLDTTLRSMEAIGLFRKLGFYEIPRYNANPDAQMFMEKTL